MSTDNQESRVRNEPTIRAMIAAGFVGSFDRLSQEETYELVIDQLGIRDKLRPQEVDDLRLMIAVGFELFQMPGEAVH